MKITEKNMTNLLGQNFTGLYPVSKTLRFRLIPEGKTLEAIRAGAFIEKDQEKADKYVLLKKTIDAFHRDFIEKAMSLLAEKLRRGEEGDKKAMTLRDLETFAAVYAEFRKDRIGKQKDFAKTCEELRKKLVSGSFNDASLKGDFEGLFNEKLFEKLLAWRDENPAKAKEDNLFFDDDGTFKRFSTYFTGFHENRKNMYTAEDKATAIPRRLINENLPKYLDNAQIAPLYKEVLAAAAGEMTEEEKAFLAEKSIDELALPSGYAACLTQKGIDAYNALLGGYTREGKEKVRGINEFINLHNQKLADKRERVPLLKPLYKLILGNTKSLSILPKAFESTDAMYEAIDQAYTSLLADKDLLIAPVRETFRRLASGEFDTSKIWLSRPAINTLSQRVFGRYSFAADALEYAFVTNECPDWTAKMSKAKSAAAAERLEKQKEAFAGAAYTPLSRIIAAVESYRASLDDPGETPGGEAVRGYFFKFFVKEARNAEGKSKLYAWEAYLAERYSTLKGELCVKHDKNYRPAQETVDKVKDFLDAIMEMTRFVQDACVRRKDENTVEKDTDFYAVLDEATEKLFDFSFLYDKVRNFVTSRTSAAGKIRLTFDRPSLANGWDKNKEQDNGCVILRKDGQYYLAVIRKDSRTDLGALPEPADGEAVFEKMVYKYFPNTMRMIPKCVMTRKEVKAAFEKGAASYRLFDPKTFIKALEIPRDIYEAYTAKKHKAEYAAATKDESGYREALTRWLALCTEFLHVYKSTAGYNLALLKKPEEYEKDTDFFTDVDTIAYAVSFTPVSAARLYALVDKGEVFLFRIHNKDFGASTGTPNLHTIYWRALFSEENLAKGALKLNGEAELFYRVAAIEDPVIHRKGETIVNKTTKDGRTIPDHLYAEICGALAGKKPESDLSSEAKAFLPAISSRPAPHDIVKDRRYTENTFLFHVPVTFNYKAPKRGVDINGTVRQYIRGNEDLPIIGLDRGERHLLYLCVIDGKGNILEQKTLNTVSGTDYHDKLDVREKERGRARESWSSIGKIADLKQGYLSYVIHEITGLMLKYGAPVVLEDLNFGFKRGRFKVEKQVYQNFEKALITKLNCLVSKNSAIEEAGGALNPYQLTKPFESFRKMGKQNGFLFYIPAWNTSKIDPVTGFTDKLKPRYTNRRAANEFFKQFETIRWNDAEEAFEFSWKEERKSERMGKTIETKWTARLGHEERFYWDSKANSHRGAEKSVDLARELASAFAGTGYEDGRNLRPLLADTEDITMLKSVMWCLKTGLAMRYSSAAKGLDFILSPVCAPNGKVFRTEDADEKLPANADANGAYNIARKGLLLMRRIREQQADKKTDLNITNSDWLDYTQNGDTVAEQMKKM